VSAGREEDSFTRTPVGVPPPLTSPDLCNYDEHFDAHQIILSLKFCVSPELLLYLPSTFARAQLTRVTGLAMMGPHLDLARIPARIVNLEGVVSDRHVRPAICHVAPQSRRGLKGIGNVKLLGIQKRL